MADVVINVEGDIYPLSSIKQIVINDTKKKASFRLSTVGEAVVAVNYDSFKENWDKLVSEGKITVVNTTKKLMGDKNME
jgi:hypothetical protein